MFKGIVAKNKAEKMVGLFMAAGERAEVIKTNDGYCCWTANRTFVPGTIAFRQKMEALTKI
jgi:hypothetical protein